MPASTLPDSAGQPLARPDRSDKHTIAAHFKIEAYREFKRLAADELKSTDALLHEAVALLFEKRQRPVPVDIKYKLIKLGIYSN